MTANPELADRAAELSRRARPGSDERTAAWCVSVALGTTRTADAARAALKSRTADEHLGIRASAGRLLDRLLAGA